MDGSIHSHNNFSLPGGPVRSTCCGETACDEDITHLAAIALADLLNFDPCKSSQQFGDGFPRHHPCQVLGPYCSLGAEYNAVLGQSK